MDLVYGNDGMNYRTFAKSDTITTRVEQQLLGSYVKYYFPGDTSIYTMPEKEPESILYVTSDLGRALPKEYVILTKNGRMRNFSTPSFYAHSHLVSVDPDFYKEQFFDIFSMEFLSDLEASAMTGRELSTYQPKMRRDIRDNAISQNQLKSVLYILYYYELIGNPVKIMLDETGDNYNRRSREVLKSIYRYLPYDYRKRYGFASYMDDQQVTIPRVKFELYDRSQVKKINAIDVDLANCDSERIRSKIGRTQICEYVDQLVDMSFESRKEHFDSLEDLYKGKRLNLKAVLEYMTNEKSWKTKPVSTLLPIWVEYVYLNCLKKGPLYERMIHVINERIDNETYNKYLMDEIRNVKADLMELPESIRRLLLFADYVPGLQVDTDALVDWDARYRRDDQPETFAEIEEKCDVLRAEIDKLKKLDLGVNSFENVKESMIEIRELDLDEFETKKNRIIERAKSSIEKLVNSLNPITSELDTNEILKWAKYYGKYPELYQYLRNVTGKRIKILINLNLDEVSENVQGIELMNMALERLRGLMNPEDYQECEASITDKMSEIQKIKALKEIKTVVLKERKDLIRLIKELQKQEDIQERYSGEGERKLTIQIGRAQITETLSEINSLCEFLIDPNEVNLQCFWGLNLKNGQNNILLDQFIESDLFSMNHLSYLEYILKHRKSELGKYVASNIDAYINKKDKVYNKELSSITLLSDKSSGLNVEGYYGLPDETVNTPPEFKAAEQPEKESKRRSLFSKIFN